MTMTGCECGKVSGLNDIPDRDDEMMAFISSEGNSFFII